LVITFNLGELVPLDLAESLCELFLGDLFGDFKILLFNIHLKDE